MASFSRPLLALIVGQVCLHSCMSGIRVAGPLLALRSGQPAWVVGVLLGLFAAAPVLSSMYAGRLADRHGYHRPARLAVGLTVAGGGLAILSTWFADVQLVLLGLAACLCGVGTNLGLIANQRTAGRLADGDRAALTRVFSWLGLAPAVSNVIGPVMAGALIDLSGFRGAFIALTLLPLATLWSSRQVPKETPVVPKSAPGKRATWDLFVTPGMPRLLFINFLMSSSWDLHSFIVPVIGHERGYSASAIGLILGVFAAAVAGVRVIIPFMSHRLREHQVLASAMVLTALVLCIYPWVHSAWLMGLCAAALGLALGAVNPMVMTALHHLTPSERHGEAIALRSMTVNASSALMPLLFGALGAAVGASTLFWVMGAAVGVGSWQARLMGGRA
ncbi:MFS transporter [Piscinibacter sp. HJYY11]|uniref:MFS transporter n=1 Tax=Piscinibacter sp. HJYY11 TaxID=2801333 RepID=UPI00191D292A|nr:MFS transporter [Piscinibacter sp. HJYY11]MBL0731021.1 MFS transporter [Piscinibacter sp. HJYY11]